MAVDQNAVVGEFTTLTWADLGRILEDVNKIRVALGIGQGNLPELPKGIKGEPEMCVLAKALSNGWNVEVDGGITLTHPDAFDKPFDWEKAVKVLTDLGFDATYDSGIYEFDCSCGSSCCSGTYEEYESEPEIVIELTPGMNTLIQDFDKGNLPFLVLED